MLKFILPATILLSLMISSQALACRARTDHYCMVSVVYHGTSFTTSAKFEGKTNPQEFAKDSTCKTLCKDEEACVSDCVAKAEFPFLRCEWMNACKGWPGGMVPMEEQEDTARAKLCGELCEGKDACIANCIAGDFSEIRGAE